MRWHDLFKTLPLVVLILSISLDDRVFVNSNTNTVTKWVDEETEPSRELQELYAGLEYPSEHETYAAIGGEPPKLVPGATYDWYRLLRGLQGAPTLKAIQSGNLKHLVEYSMLYSPLNFFLSLSLASNSSKLTSSKISSSASGNTSLTSRRGPWRAGIGNCWTRSVLMI